MNVMRPAFMIAAASAGLAEWVQPDHKMINE
jgi:hypothetical protein